MPVPVPVLLEVCPLRPNDEIRVDLPASWAPLTGTGWERNQASERAWQPSREDERYPPMTMTRLLDPLLLLLLLLLLPPVPCSFDPLVP